MVIYKIRIALEQKKCSKTKTTKNNGFSQAVVFFLVNFYFRNLGYFG